MKLSSSCCCCSHSSSLTYIYSQWLVWQCQLIQSYIHRPYTVTTVAPQLWGQTDPSLPAHVTEIPHILPSETSLPVCDTWYTYILYCVCRCDSMHTCRQQVGSVTHEGDTIAKIETVNQCLSFIICRENNHILSFKCAPPHATF